MIKTIFWDFDGVILNSMKIKGDGFVELFKHYDKKYVDAIEKYHYAHGGVSRFDKIRYFYEKIIQKNIDENEINFLADKFSNIIQKKLFNKENLISDTIEFIQKHYKNYNFHIVSGAEHNELNTLCKHFEIYGYFKTIDGSPTKKNILVKRILEKYNYKPKESVLIGDALSDYKAAEDNNIDFYGYNNPALQKFKYIDSFRDFSL